MNDRPELTTALDGKTFRNYYYLKEGNLYVWNM